MGPGFPVVADFLAVVVGARVVVVEVVQISGFGVVQPSEIGKRFLKIEKTAEIVKKKMKNTKSSIGILKKIKTSGLKFKKKIFQKIPIKFMVVRN